MKYLSPVIGFLDKGSQVFDARAYGIVADALTATDGAMSASSAVLTSASGLFSSSDVGKSISVVGAGASSQTLRTTIFSYQSPTQVTLTATATTAVSGAGFFWGTDAKTPLGNAMSAANSIGGGIVLVPKGRYYISGRLTPYSYVKVRGAGIGQTILYGGTTNDYMFYSTTGANVTRFSIDDLTIDVQNMYHASAIGVYYAQQCTFSRVEFKNVSASGWLAKIGVSNGATDNSICYDNTFIDCVFDGHAGSLEMLLLFNCSNTQIIRPVFKNKTTSGPVLGLWQKCYDTHIVDPTFRDIVGSCIYYSVTVERTFITNPYFENTGTAIDGANTSDNGNFGLTRAEVLVITNPIVKGGANSTGSVGIRLGAVNNIKVLNPVIEGMQIGIQFHDGNNSNNVPATNWQIINPSIFNNNSSADFHTLHPGILFSDIGGTMHGFILGGDLYDDQATKNQRYPVVFDGTFTWDYITIVNVRLSADVANSGTSIRKNGSAALGSNVLVHSNIDYSGSAPSQGIPESFITNLSADLANLQPLDSDLTAIAAIAPANDDVIQRKAGAWINRTMVQLKTDLALSKSDVGLGNVDNTADLAKPISTSTQAALDAKAALASPALTGTPTAPTASPGLNNTQIASTAYVDAAVAAVLTGLDVKASVRAATTANGALSTAYANGQAIDGVTLATNDRILIKDQTTASDNGIYVVQASGAPVRATDADTSAEVTGGMFTFVEEGTTNADTGWMLSTNAPITLGTTGLTFTQFSSAGVIQAGTGLSKTGNTIALSTPVSIANGGTGSVSQNFVDISTAQTVGGAKSFSSSVTIDTGAAGTYFQTKIAGSVRTTISSLGGNDTISANSSNLLLTGATVQILRALHVPLLAKTAAYTLGAGDYTVTGDTTGGAFSLTLPTAAGIAGRTYILKRISAGANNLTVATTSSQTIDGATTYVLGAQYKYVAVQSDGANWIIVGNN